jgi:Lon protease-like protein
MPGIFPSYTHASDLPAEIPVFPLSGALLLPRTDLPLNIFEPRYLAMFDDAMRNHRIIGMIQPAADDAADVPKLAPVGCAGRITSYGETPDGRLLITLSGIARFKRLKELKQDKPYRMVKTDYRPFAIDFAAASNTANVNRQAVLRAFRDYLEANEMTTDWNEVEQVNTETLVNTLSLMAPYPASDKQALLEARDLKSRADMLVALTELALARQTGGRKNLQ